MPKRRKFKTNEKVAVIKLCNRNPAVFEGLICSGPNTHVNVDNITRVVVWTKFAHNDLADNADDAYEISIDVDDPQLLKEKELEKLLSDITIVAKRFPSADRTELVMIGWALCRYKNFLQTQKAVVGLSSKE